MSDAVKRARSFLGGESVSFEEADTLWQELKKADETSLARKVLMKIRANDGLLGGLSEKRKGKLCQQQAMLTSKDPELHSSVRYELAFHILAEGFGSLEDPALNGDGETLGIAGGILKRRWQELGQVEDLEKAAKYYRRGVGDDLGTDAYAHINLAFVLDLLAEAGDEPDARRHKAEAKTIRERIVKDLPVQSDNWFNVATRIEADLGLGNYGEAIDALTHAETKPDPWELKTTAQQLAALAHIKEEKPLEDEKLRELFERLLGDADAARSVIIGKVGLALSGGGFRASFYHLGVLARLAELGVLKHVEVLSCVSGGSIAGACYWLALRKRLEDLSPGGAIDYIELVYSLIEHFEEAVKTDLRDEAQPTLAKLVGRILRGKKGAIDPLKVAEVLEKRFYRPLRPGDGPLFMHDLAFVPSDHQTERVGPTPFSPSKHNWLRAHKVPMLVLNATTVNTGHAWEFTPEGMGELPWAVHEPADSVPRLQWSKYEPKQEWQIGLGQAVAASACVPGVFAPYLIENAYENLVVQLVDGGVYDNQGTTALLNHECNVILVSDAAGQLTLEDRPQKGLKGLRAYVGRSFGILMERIRQVNFGDLSARLESGRLRGLMFLHMKSGLDADELRLRFSSATYKIERRPLSPSGVRKDFQQALAELRTDLDAFTPDESRSLMACGYQMAKRAFQQDMAKLDGLWDEPAGEAVEWPFMAELGEITSTEAHTDRRDKLLAALRKGSGITIFRPTELEPTHFRV